MFEKISSSVRKFFPPTTPSWTFFLVCLAFVGGILFASVSALPWLILWLATWMTAVAGAAAFQSPRSLQIVLCVLFLILGFSREQYARQAVTIAPRELIGHVTVVDGHVTNDPILSARAEFFNVAIADGNVTVVTPPDTLVARGDNVTMRCTFQAGKQNDVECPFPKEFVNNGTAQTPDLWLRVVRDTFVSKLNQVFAAPISGFLSGLLVTGSTDLTTEWRQAFRTTGTAHLVALSGYNVSIIATVILWLLARLACPRKWRLIIIGMTLTSFVIMVGAGPSIVRAAIMGMLAAYATHIGRPSYTRNSLAATAAIMLLLDPTLMTQSLSFQLSFLATIAVVVVYPLFEKRTAHWPSCLGAKEAMLMAISAEMLVTPFLVLAFGQVSIISPLANALVVPLVPFLMLFAFVGTISGFIALPIGRVFGIPAWLGSVYVLKLIQWAAALPFAAIAISVSIPLLIFYYAVVVVAVVLTYKKQGGP